MHSNRYARVAVVIELNGLSEKTRDVIFCMSTGINRDFSCRQIFLSSVKLLCSNTV